MTKKSQEMPILMVISGIDSLTTEDMKKIKGYMERGSLLDVQFKDANGEVFIPVAYTPEVKGDDSTTPATVTVINNGNVVKADVVMGAPVISGETPFETKTEVTMTSEEGASIFYTTDGSTPTEESTEYTAAIELSATTTVKAIAVKGTDVSPVASKTFTKS